MNQSKVEKSPMAIRVKDLKFGFSKEKPIIKSCSLEVPQGEFWMLLGDNGCGKSTLLKLIAGLLTPDLGKIEIDSPIGFVFQNPDRQLVMPTVASDIAFGLVSENLSPKKVRLRVREALEAVNLLDLENRPIYALSGGQKQRIAIAGAIARHCSILLLDEPTALLDRDTQIDLVSTVKDLVKSRGITGVWVTHRLEELQFADGAFLLGEGKVLASGDPLELGKRLLQIQEQEL